MFFCVIKSNCNFRFGIGFDKNLEEIQKIFCSKFQKSKTPKPHNPIKNPREFSGPGHGFVKP